MVEAFSNGIKEKYKELIQYISQLGHKVSFSGNNSIELTINVYDYLDERILKIHLFQPLDREWEYNYHRLRISWTIPPNECLGNNRWYLETSNQVVIFNTLLFDIINFKIKNIDKTTIDKSNAAIYGALNEWLKNKEHIYNKKIPKQKSSLLNYIKNFFIHKNK